MAIIRLETLINAPLERCFDLSRSVDLHIESAKLTKEKAIEGITSGLMHLHDEVTWEAYHFGIKQRLKVKITSFERPFYFQDSQVNGIFKYFKHDHFFEERGDATLMKDIFDFKCPYGVLGTLVEPIIFAHLKRFLLIRNQEIKDVAESERWNSIL